MSQSTIATSICAKGWSNALEREAYFSINPVEDDTGIVLRRVDLAHTPVFRLKDHSSTAILAKEKYRFFNLSSFRPLLAVFRALGIDNVIIDCEGPQLPWLENNTSGLVFLVKSAGIKSQATERFVIRLNKAVSFTENGKWAKLIPNTRMRLAVLNSPSNEPLTLTSPGIVVEFSSAMFVSELCHARTVAELDQLVRSHNSNTINQAAEQNLKQRFAHEAVLNSLFNAYADLAMLAFPIVADYVGYKADSAINRGLLQSLIKDKSALAIETEYFSSHQMDDSQFKNTGKPKRFAVS